MVAAELRGGDKPSLNEALGWIGSRIDDIYGTGVGRLEDVWIDPGTGVPRWLLVKEGRFGGRTTLIPFEDATAGAGHVWIPYERDVVRGAPEVEPGSPLTQQLEAELRRHYAERARSESAPAATAPSAGAQQQPAQRQYQEPSPPGAAYERAPEPPAQFQPPPEQRAAPPPVRPAPPPARPTGPEGPPPAAQPTQPSAAEAGPHRYQPYPQAEPPQPQPPAQHQADHQGAGPYAPQPAQQQPPPAPAAPAAPQVQVYHPRLEPIPAADFERQRRAPDPPPAQQGEDEQHRPAAVPVVNDLDQAYRVEIQLEGEVRISGELKGFKMIPIDDGEARR